MDYFVLSATEDGDVSFEKLTKEQIEENLSDYGNDALSELPKDFELERFSGTIIIKGTLVSPKPVKIVEGYTID